MSRRHFRWQGHHVAVDPAPQILRLEMDPMASWQEVRAGSVGKRRTDGEIQIIEYDPDERFEGPLYPSLAAMPDQGSFVSASVLAAKAKAVDDGIVAALEVLVDEGDAGFLGRTTLLATMEGAILRRWEQGANDPALAEAIGLLSAVRSLAGDEDFADPSAWPVALRLRRARHLRRFREDQEVGVILGIYSWSPRLAGLFRQGKALQKPLEDEVASELSGVLESDESLRAAYEKHLAVASLTNPLAGPHLLSGRDDEADPGDPRAFLPASESPEGRLLKRLVGSRPVPPGFDLVGEMIARVGDGRTDLATAGESGWYDHVLHALEPLIAPDRSPEAAKLRLADDYRADLKDLFRSLLGATRETHVKQIESPVGGGCPLVVRPHLTFEPLAEHYRRRAESYRFIRERLAALLGEGTLLARERLTPEPTGGAPLLDELVAMEQFYTGAWAIVLDELGIASELEEGERRYVLAAKAAARSWASTHHADPDLAEDARMMVPLFRDVERKEFHVLAMIGYEQRNLRVGFDERPIVTVRNGGGQIARPRIYWSRSSYPLARPVTIACRTRRLLDRPDFRALCDREGSAGAIRSALEA